LGISYWDQTQVVWYALLAAISAVVAVRPNRKSTQVPTQLASDWFQFAETDPAIKEEPIETAPPTQSGPQRFFAV
jgi:hypothetical protein